MLLLDPSLWKPFAWNICIRDTMKNSILGYFCKSTYSQIRYKFQLWWLFGRWLMCLVLQIEISHPHITSHVLFAKAFENLRRKWLWKFRWEKIDFFGLKKRLLFLMEGKYKWIFPKNMLSSSLLSYLLTYLLTYLLHRKMNHVCYDIVSYVFVIRVESV